MCFCFSLPTGVGCVVLFPSLLSLYARERARAYLRARGVGGGGCDITIYLEKGKVLLMHSDMPSWLVDFEDHYFLIFPYHTWNFENNHAFSIKAGLSGLKNLILYYVKYHQKVHSSALSISKLELSTSRHYLVFSWFSNSEPQLPFDLFIGFLRVIRLERASLFENMVKLLHKPLLHHWALLPNTTVNNICISFVLFTEPSLLSLI